jgi:hypothetical protein
MDNSVKGVFDRLLDAPEQTIAVGSAFRVLGRRFGFKANFTASPHEVRRAVERKDTRAPIVQEMLRLYGAKNIVTQSDDLAAHLGGLLKLRLTKALNNQVAIQVATVVSSQFQLSAQMANPAKANVDLFCVVSSAVQQALLEGFLGRPLTLEVKQRLSNLMPAPVGIEGVVKVFGFALVSHAGRLERFLPRWAFKQVMRVCLPKVAATREHRRQFSTIICEHIQSASNLSADSWLADVLKEFRFGRISEDDLHGEIAAIYDTSYALSLGSMWSIFCVANSPEHQGKLRLQSQADVGDGSVSAVNHARLCALEALRLYPPFYMLGYTKSEASLNSDAVKQSGCPMKWLGLLTAASDTVVSVHRLHRNREFWHDADSFWPERFQGVSLDERKKTPKGSFIPFGAGHRACPGRAMSMTVIERLLNALFGSASPVSLELPKGMPKQKRNALLMAQDTQILVGST